MRAKNTKLALVILLILASLLFENSYGTNVCNFPAIFNFGDSNSDTAAGTGEDGSLREPYGQTWRAKDGERRRFSDGRLIIDFITEKLGLPYLSGYEDPNGSFSKGVNFAVSGATLQRHDMGPTSYGPMFSSMVVTQKQQFEFIRNRAVAASSLKSAGPQSLPMPEDFPKALYTIDIGQNDINNLLVLKGPKEMAAEIPNMIKDFSSFIQEIYQYGGRNFWIHNIGPLGCLSRTAQLEPRDEIGCSKPDNDAAQEFNKQLKDMLSKLRQQLKDVSLIYVDVYSAKYSLFKDAAKFGFKNPLDYCCKGVSPYSSCGQYAYDDDGNYVLSPPCPNPKEYIIFDGRHYTEAANQIVANRVMDGSLSDPPVPITEACAKSSPQKIEL